MKDDKKGHSSESDRLTRAQQALAQARELSARLEKKYGKVERKSEEEREWRWRQIMRRRSLQDDV